jgi:hypothetical protein
MQAAQSDRDMSHERAFSPSRIFSKYPELSVSDRTVLEVDIGESSVIFRCRGQDVDANADHTREAENFRQGLESGEALLPFPDGAFDHVFCATGFELLPRAARRPFIRDMVRVASRSAVLSSSFEHPGKFGQRAMIESWLARHGKLPKWLQVDAQLDRPKLEDIMDEVLILGLPIDFFGDTTMLEHVANRLLGNEFAFANSLLSRQQFKSPGEPALSGSGWDIFHSYGLCIFKETDLSRLPPTQRASPATRPKGRSMAIYACCHNAKDIRDFGDVTVLKVGAAADSATPDDLTDVLSDGSRLLNSRWSELSGYYKVWREGPTSDVVGFCHYRRFFDFLSPAVDQGMTVVQEHQVPDIKARFVDHAAYDLCVSGSRVLVPRPFHFPASAFHQYADIHNADDLCLVVSLISKLHPELLPYARDMFSGNALFPCNMFVMSWSLFDQLCPIWFGILQAFEELVPPGRASAYQNRDISFLAERVFDVWLRYAKDKLGVDVQHRPIFFVTR